MLPISKLEWKFENQAQGAPRKKVADEAGYEALIDAVNARRRQENVVVWLYTPKPNKDDEVCMFHCILLTKQHAVHRIGTPVPQTMLMNHLILIKKSTKNLLEVRPNSCVYPIKSIVNSYLLQWQNDMVQKVKDAQAEIERMYPAGGCLLFPDKRVWHNKRTDAYFELSQVRIKFWAASIVSAELGAFFMGSEPFPFRFQDGVMLQLPQSQHILQRRIS